MEKTKLKLCDLAESNGPDHWSIIHNGPIVYLTCNRNVAETIAQALDNLPEERITEFCKLAN